MDLFVFAHIPKTAGTSFRLGADQYFGEKPVAVEVLIDGNLIGTAKAKNYQPHIGQIGVHRGGYVGFNLKVPKMKVGDSIECRVAETGQSLIGSPRLVTEKDVGNT